DAAVPVEPGAAAGQPAVGGRQPARVRGTGRRGHHEGHLRPRRGAGGVAGIVPPRAVTFDYWNTLFSEPVPGAAGDARLRRFRGWLMHRGADYPDEIVLDAHRSALEAHWESWRSGRQFGSPGAVNHVLALLRLDL